MSMTLIMKTEQRRCTSLFSFEAGRPNILRKHELDNEAVDNARRSTLIYTA